jgi:hypothetical protein
MSLLVGIDLLLDIIVGHGRRKHKYVWIYILLAPKATLYLKTPLSMWSIE